MQISTVTYLTMAIPNEVNVMLIIVGALIKILLVILVCTVFLILLINIIEIKWRVFSKMMPNDQFVNYLSAKDQGACGQTCKPEKE